MSSKSFNIHAVNKSIKNPPKPGCSAITWHQRFLETDETRAQRGLAGGVESTKKTGTREALFCCVILLCCS